VEPDAERTDGHGDDEEDAQDFAAASPEAHERGAAGDEEQRGVGEREPGGPRLAEDFPVLEADFGEKERRAAEDRRDHRFFSVHRAPPCEA
jgi:hypothetical protein